METLADIARRAADLIAERGHAKHSLSDGEGYCYFGAVCMAIAGDPRALLEDSPGRDEMLDKSTAISAATSQIVFGREDGISRIVDWNNAPERTAEDVILALKKTAELLDGQKKRSHG